MHGDFTRFARLVRYRLHREAFGLCGDWHEAEDLVQITLCRVFQLWETLANHDQLTGYARKILLNAYLADHRRVRWQYESYHAELPECRNGGCPAFDERVALVMLVSQLSPRQRSVVVFRFWAGLTIGETASALGCTCSTVTSHTQRALDALRTALTDPKPTGATGDDDRTVDTPERSPTEARTIAAAATTSPGSRQPQGEGRALMRRASRSNRPSVTDV